MFSSSADRRDAENVAITLVEADPDPDSNWEDESTFMHEAGIRAFSVGFIGAFTTDYVKSMASLPREEFKNWSVRHWFCQQL